MSADEDPYWQRGTEAALQRDVLAAEAVAAVAPPPVAAGLRLAWHAAQRTDTVLQPLTVHPTPGYRLSATDGVLEREV